MSIWKNAFKMIVIKYFNDWARLAHQQLLGVYLVNKSQKEKTNTTTTKGQVIVPLVTLEF